MARWPDDLAELTTAGPTAAIKVFQVDARAMGQVRPESAVGRFSTEMDRSRRSSQSEDNGHWPVPANFVKLVSRESLGEYWGGRLTGC